MKKISRILLLLFTCFFISSCGLMERASPEKRLLAVFQNELTELKNNESASYADYMARRDLNFQNRQKMVNELIKEINNSFDGKTEDEKQAYQTHWRTFFQPVVEEIYTRTQDLVARETRELTPEKMARIKELSIRHKALEKELPQATLNPQFFILPEETP